MNSGAKWVGENSQIIRAMKIAKAEKRLYVESQGKTNLVCDACGETNVRFNIVSICVDRETLEADPMGGMVYVFGASCFKAVKAELDKPIDPVEELLNAAEDSLTVLRVLASEGRFFDDCERRIGLEGKLQTAISKVMESRVKVGKPRLDSANNRGE